MPASHAVVSSGLTGPDISAVALRLVRASGGVCHLRSRTLIVGLDVQSDNLRMHCIANECSSGKAPLARSSLGRVTPDPTRAR